MSAAPYYYRDVTCLYPLQSHSDYWFHVGRSEAEQAIFGYINNKLLHITFSPAGDLIAVREAIFQPQNLAPSSELTLEKLHEAIDTQAMRYRKMRRLKDACIHIKRFSLPRYNIGIRDVSDDLETFIFDPGSYDLADRIDLGETLQAWKEESLFVFWWDEDFYVDSEGLVSSS